MSVERLQAPFVLGCLVPGFDGVKFLREWKSGFRTHGGRTSPNARASNAIQLGFLHLDIAEVQTAEGKRAIDQTRKFAVT